MGKFCFVAKQTLSQMFLVSTWLVAMLQYTRIHQVWSSLRMHKVFTAAKFCTMLSRIVFRFTSFLATLNSICPGSQTELFPRTTENPVRRGSVACLHQHIPEVTQLITTGAP